MSVVYKNGRPYVYQSIRVNGRVTSRYLGCHPETVEFEELVGLAADVFAEERAERKAEERRELLRAKAEDDEAEAPVVDACRLAAEEARQALEEAGYRRVGGHWRKRRVARPGGA